MSPIIRFMAAAIFVTTAIVIVVFFGNRRDEDRNNRLATPIVTPTVAFLEMRKLNTFMRPIDEKDHIMGNQNAQVKLIEFADLECPFCKKFHPIMKKVIEEYGKDDRVAWVYRHFPLPSHPRAKIEAEAAECAAELKGHEAFWSYVDKIYEVTPSENRLDLALLPQFAQELGIDATQFKDCLDSGRYTKKVETDYSDAIISGGRGNPFVVVIGPKGKRLDFSGAQPYEAVKNIIELSLKEK